MASPSVEHNWVEDHRDRILDEAAEASEQSGNEEQEDQETEEEEDDEVEGPRRRLGTPEPRTRRRWADIVEEEERSGRKLKSVAGK